MHSIDTVTPGSVIGMLGDGQLGRMTAAAAAQLGYKIAVLGPGGRESPTGQVSLWAAAWDTGARVSDELLDEFCRLVRVVLVEWENVPVELVRAIERRGVRVCASAQVLAVAQDRLHEKNLARRLNIAVPEFREVHDESGGAGETPARSACILKTRRNGYDGKGQVRIKAGECIDAAWKTLGRVPCILEARVEFVRELSVIVARSSKKNFVTYGPFVNVHDAGILRTTHYPGSVPDAVRDTAFKAARAIADDLDVIGLLAVEFFETADGTVLFNEMAPRPHNSGHLTIECCDTSQFEQYVRAACGQPLGSVRFHSAGRMQNIIGDEVLRWPEYLGCSGTSLHLYGKETTQPGRKMGHLTTRVKSL